jgi:hypothetical protein
MLTQNHRQEALSRAYIQAIIAKAGMSYSVPSNDYGIDLVANDVERYGRHRRESGYRLDIQAKSTTLARLQTSIIQYKLDLRAYDYLRRTGAGCPRILVVLVLPDRQAIWCSQSEDELVLRHCAYWMPLAGMPRTANRKSILLGIPRTNLFSPEALRGIMKRIKAGGTP